MSDRRWDAFTDEELAAVVYGLEVAGAAATGAPVWGTVGEILDEAEREKAQRDLRTPPLMSFGRETCSGWLRRIRGGS